MYILVILNGLYYCENPCRPPVCHAYPPRPVLLIFCDIRHERKFAFGQLVNGAHMTGLMGHPHFQSFFLNLPIEMLNNYSSSILL